MIPKRRVLSLALTLAGLYVGLCLLLFLVQDRLVYFPGPPPRLTPAMQGLEYRELNLRTDDGVQLHGWFLPAPEPRGALLHCHGNAGTIELRLESARAFRDMGLSVLLFDYRGYGKSEGRPSEEGTYLDAQAAHDFLVTEGFAGERIAVYGESLGGAVAIELARRRPVACVLVESTFTTMPDLGAQLYRWLPIRLLSRYRYASLDKVGELGVPLLVVHSPGDDLIPFAHGRRLYEAAREPRTFLETAGRHNDGGFLQRNAWIDTVRSFLDEALAE